MNRYREYSDKALVVIYIFNYPAEHHEETKELWEELEWRGLIEWAEQTYGELLKLFNEKWEKWEKEIEGGCEEIRKKGNNKENM